MLYSIIMTLLHGNMIAYQVQGSFHIKILAGVLTSKGFSNNTTIVQGKSHKNSQWPFDRPDAKR